MAIRIRVVDGITIALCAVESDPQPADIYIDDSAHYALDTKFAADNDGGYRGDERLLVLMDREKVRDAGAEMNKWQRDNL